MFLLILLSFFLSAYAVDVRGCVWISIDATSSQCNFPSDITATEGLLALRSKYISFVGTGEFDGTNSLRYQFEQFNGIIHSLHPALVPHEGKPEKLARASDAVFRFSAPDDVNEWMKAPTKWFVRSPDLIIVESKLINDDFLKNLENVETPVLLQIENGDQPNGLPKTVFVQQVPKLDSTKHLELQDNARKGAEGIVRALLLLKTDPDVYEQPSFTPGQAMFFIFYICVIGAVIPMEAILYFTKVNGSKNSPMNEPSNIVIPNKETEKKRDIEEVELTPFTEEKSAVQSIKPTVVEAADQTFYERNRKGFRALLVFCTVVATIFLVDGPFYRPFSPALKTYNRDFFIFLHLIILAISWITLEPMKEGQTHVMSLQQSDEWKGWMQIIFVMYHYFDAGEVYNFIRILIAAYIWGTGHGNAISFFNKQRDGKLDIYFAWTRFWGSMFRMNWLVFWVCLVLNEELLLYYVCPLHTFFTLFTTGVVWITHKSNFLTGISVGFVFLAILFEIDGVLEFVFQPFRFVLDYYGSLHEWKFRSTLDHYATFTGIICAYLQPRLDQFYTFTEKLPLRQTIIYKSLLVAPCVLLTTWWAYYIYPKPKFEYNAIHPYTFFIPVVSYILVRSCVLEWRKWNSTFLGWVGKITLESYIFQYHVYMQDDAKSNIVVFAGYPLVNYLVLTAFYLFLARMAYDSTKTLKTWVFPRPKGDFTDRDNLKRALLGSFLLFVFYQIVALILSFF